MKTDKELAIFCQNIAYLRRKHNLTKTQMSAMLGVSIRTLNRIENGIFPERLGISILEKILLNFRISPSKILSPLDESDNSNKSLNT